jgi:hypothetical protein
MKEQDELPHKNGPRKHRKRKHKKEEENNEEIRIREYINHENGSTGKGNNE